MPKYAIKDIYPNPFRHMDRYPIRRDKVEALKASMDTTGFWGNIVAREQDGGVEIAYGHHRLVSLREKYGPDDEVDLIIRDLHDDAMLQIMARENMEEWGTSASVEHETIRAVVEAYAEGRIELEPPSPDTNARSIRYAPSFTLGDDVGAPRHRPYTAERLASFLGWMQRNGRPQDKVHNALAALEFIEDGILAEQDFEGLTTMQAEAVIQQARKVKTERETEARIHAQQAQAAEREAKLAEQRAVEAERRRQQQEAEAAQARTDALRRQAERQAREAQEEQRQASEQQAAAQRRHAAEQQRAQEERAKARSQAETVGRAVSTEIKSGNIGYREAAAVRERVETKPEGPPRNLDDIARRFARELDVLLDPQRDMRYEKLRVMVEFRESLSDSTREDLVVILGRLSNSPSLGSAAIPRGSIGGIPRGARWGIAALAPFARR